MPYPQNTPNGTTRTHQGSCRLVCIKVGKVNPQNIYRCLDCKKEIR